MLFHHPQLSHQQTFAIRDGECMPAAGSTACAHPTACAPLPGWPEGQGPQLQPLPGGPRHPGPATPGTCGQCITLPPLALFQFIQEADWHTQVTTSSYCRAHHNAVFTQTMTLMLHVSMYSEAFMKLVVVSFTNMRAHQTGNTCHAGH